MSETVYLPPNCVLRPAAERDRRSIRLLLNQFRQEILPPTPPSIRVLKGAVFLLLAGLGVYLIQSLGPEQLLHLILLPAMLLSLLMLVIVVVTWNEEWAHFWVIELEGDIVACAKLRQCRHYSILYDLYVVPEWRGRQIGSYLVNQLGQAAQKPLYLACLPTLIPFYKRLGFTRVSPKSLPPLVQYDLGIPGRFEVVPLARVS